MRMFRILGNTTGLIREFNKTGEEAWLDRDIYIDKNCGDHCWEINSLETGLVKLRLVPLEDPHMLVPYVLDISVSDFLLPVAGGLVPCLGLYKKQ